MTKKMKPTDLRRLNALVRDEHMASVEYDQMSKDFRNKGQFSRAKLFLSMSRDEAEHELNIKNLIKALERV